VKAAAVVLVLAACSGKVAIDPTDRTAVLGALNRDIPARMVSYLDFELRQVANGIRPLTVDAIVPAGWVSSVPDDRYAAWLSPKAPSRLAPLDNVMALGVDCVGTCGAKDWPAVIAAEATREVPDDGLLGDEPLPEGGRVRWGRRGNKATAYAAWAAPGDVQLRKCVVRLAASTRPDRDVVDAIGVFAAACKAARFTVGATPRSGT